MERKKREQNDSVLNAINKQNITSNSNNTTNTLVDDELIINTSDSDNTGSSSSDSENSEIDYCSSSSKPIRRRKRKNKKRLIICKQTKNLTPWLDKFNEISLQIEDTSLDSCTEEINEIANTPDLSVAVNDSDKPKFSDRFKKIVDTTTGKDLEWKKFDEWAAKRRKNKDQA
jgi:hypothetical protein